MNPAISKEMEMKFFARDTFSLSLFENAKVTCYHVSFFYTSLSKVLLIFV